MLQLKRLSLNDGLDIYQMLQEISSNDNGFHNKVYGMTIDEYKQWLRREYDVDNGCLEDWMVPQSSFWLYDGEYPVGYGRIRHKLNDRLEQMSGHIGYAIRKTQRNKGYGNNILTLLLNECRSLGLQSVQISANEDNAPSNKIIKRHGGELIRIDVGKCFYKINL